MNAALNLRVPQAMGLVRRTFKILSGKPTGWRPLGDLGVDRIKKYNGKTYIYLHGYSQSAHSKKYQIIPLLPFRFY